MHMNKHSLLLIGLAGLLVFLSLYLFKRSPKNTKESLAYKNCRVQYNHYEKGESFIYPGHTITNEMEYAAAQRKLALCLCNEYIKSKDPEAGKKIYEIYKKGYGNYWQGNDDESGSYNNLDSLIKYKETIFDTTITID